jgi:hypothetical protein
MTKVRKLYSSPNGDRWYVAHIEIGAFLSSGRGPEHQELLRLIGTLLDDEAAHSSRA